MVRINDDDIVRICEKAKMTIQRELKKLNVQVTTDVPKSYDDNTIEIYADDEETDATYCINISYDVLFT